MDRICTGTKGTASGVLRTTGRELSGLLLYREQRETNAEATTSDAQRRGANRATKEGKASGRSDRHCHFPEEARDACEIQEEPVDELQEYLYP